MTRVLLLGDGISTEMLRQILSDRGVDVVVSSGAMSNHESVAYDASIDVERLCIGLDAAVLGATSAVVPRGLLGTAMAEAMRRTPLVEVVSATPDNSRPYLKRRRGRNVASPGLDVRCSLNSIAKRRNRA